MINSAKSIQSKSSFKKSDGYLLKLIIIGDCGVGKTNVLVRFCENQFRFNYTATIGVDFKVKTIQVDDTKIKLQIWDTAGQQRYKNITQAYYKSAAGIILVYSVTEVIDPKSEKWMRQISQHAPSDVVKILVGNKSDAEEQREVTEVQGRALADKYQIPFVQCSAKTGSNIHTIFETVGKLLVQIYIPSMHQLQKGNSLKNKSQKQIKNKCC